MHPDHQCRSRNFIEAVARSAGLGPDRKAILVSNDGVTVSDSISYADLLARAHGLSGRLADLAPVGSRAVLAMEPGIDFIVALLACMYAELIAVPAAPLKQGRQSRSGHRLHQIVKDCAPQLVLCCRTGVEPLSAIAPIDRIVDVETLIGAQPRSTIGSDTPACAAAPEQIALLQYTSGSTTAPKGVILTHANLLHNQKLIQSVFSHDESSVIVGWLPLFHDMGLIGSVFNTLYAGSLGVLMSPMSFLQQPLRWLRAVSHFRGTTSGGPNFAYELCLAAAAREPCSDLDLSCWTAAFVGAEPISAQTLSRFANSFSPCGFSRQAFLPCYGLAEATLIVSGNSRSDPVIVRDFDRDALGYPRGTQEWAVAIRCADANQQPLVSSGAPVAGADVAIVDPATAGLCNEGDVGEIWVSGPSVGRGYWNDSSMSATVFEARLPTHPGQTFLRTGDLGLLSEGQLFICGRLADRFKFRGRNFFAMDIERLACESDSRLTTSASAAFLLANESQDQVALVQEIPRSLTADDLPSIARGIRAALLDQLGLRLDQLVFCTRGVVPRTSSGKVRRQACRDLLVEGALSHVAQFPLPASQGAQGTDATPIPTTDIGSLERLICQQLGLDLTNSSPSTRLAELGVDSMTLVNLHSQLCQWLSVEVPLARFLQADTLSDLQQLARSEWQNQLARRANASHG